MTKKITTAKKLERMALRLHRNGRGFVVGNYSPLSNRRAFFMALTMTTTEDLLSLWNKPWKEPSSQS